MTSSFHRSIVRHYLVVLLFVLQQSNTIWCLWPTDENDQQHSTLLKYNCPENEVDKLDEISARIVSLTGEQRSFPENKYQLIPYCSATKADLRLLEHQMNQCLTGTARQFGLIITYSFKNVMKHQCNIRNRKRMENLFYMTRCVKKVQKQTQTCLVKYIDAVQRAKRSEPSKNRIGYACCDYFHFLDCLEQATRSMCPEKATRLIQNFVRNTFNSLVDASCGDFTENSDRCDHLPVLEQQHIDRIMKSFTLPLIELWNNLPIV